MQSINKPALAEKLTTPFRDSKMFSMLMLGYASGLPLMLTASSLLLWYKDSGISTQNIAFLTLIALPYTFKYLWAPFLDKINIPGLGRRKGWILLTQISLILLIATMSLFHQQTPLNYCLYWLFNLLCINNPRHCNKCLSSRNIRRIRASTR